MTHSEGELLDDMCALPRRFNCSHIPMIPTYAGLPKRKMIRVGKVNNIKSDMQCYTLQSKESIPRETFSLESKNGMIIYLSSTYIVHVIRIRPQTGCAVRFVDTFMKSVRRLEPIFLPVE